MLKNRSAIEADFVLPNEFAEMFLQALYKVGTGRDESVAFKRTNLI